MKKYTIIASLCCLLPILGYGQVLDALDEQLEMFPEPIIFNISLSPTIAFPSGAGAEEIRSSIDEKSDNFEYANYEGSFGPRWGYGLHVTIAYRLNERFSAGIQLGNTQAGYKIKESFTFNDPDVQYDEVVEASTKLKISATTFSPIARYKLFPGFTVCGGPQLLFTRSKNARYLSEFSKATYTNAEYNEQLSLDTQREEVPIGDELKSMVIGARLAMDIQVYDNLNVMLGGQYASSMFKNNEPFKMSFFLIEAGISYTLSFGTL